MAAQPDPLSYFRLQPIRAARVSEISETTAAAPVSDDERVNFHIGNPLQDEALSSAFLRIALGIDIQQDTLRDSDPEAILDALGWDAADLPKIEFLIRTIRRSSPYMPRGGYARKAPHALIKAFCFWLEHQQEPLRYDTGEHSGRREIILSSGGITETLRIVLFALSDYLEVKPAQILCYHYELLPELKRIPHLEFKDLDSNEQVAQSQIEALLLASTGMPTFIVIGDLISEEMRRKLRRLCIRQPLFFIEANNAPNHLSLAREAKLVDRVIRLLTPAIFAPRLHPLSTVFLAGNADFMNVIENVHFSLKGTPSASEIELLIYLLDQNLAQLQPNPITEVPPVKPSFDGLGLNIAAERVVPQLAERIEQRLEGLVSRNSRRLENSLLNLEEKTAKVFRHLQNFWEEGIVDELSMVDTKDLFEQLVQYAHDPIWSQALQRSFLSAFVKHQPQYQANACTIVSGSSRTALGILGFHCGIKEVVIPDLSWSYEQCFPKVHTVPLTASLSLDINAILAKVEQLIQQDPAWRQYGAVVINNPHNATGRIFDEAAIRTLITYCLQHNITVIDDLAYQNVAPVDDFPLIKTARQITVELVQHGIVDESQARRVITVHSMSKTDCLAGARLAVIEIGELQLRQAFEKLNIQIQPNIQAIFLCYLFYRNSPQSLRTYWHLRNRIFYERTQALLTAEANLPQDRNPFGLKILPPSGSMYPLLQIQRLPTGLSLDWLASSLARRGIGLLPLATFARTEEGFETGRTTFRLTLGGVDNAEILQAKTRRLLIDMNRLVAEEDARYNRKRLSFRVLPDQNRRAGELSKTWQGITQRILEQYHDRSFHQLASMPELGSNQLNDEFLKLYVPERLDLFRNRLLERAFISDELMRRALSDSGAWLSERLEGEFMKDSLRQRQQLFSTRTHDRTVHPTQMYSLQSEMVFEKIVPALISKQPVSSALIQTAARELLEEYLGRNVSVTSELEADEILLDLTTLTAGEDYADLFSSTKLTPLLSFWSDWDGSNRPSGQGFRLVTAVVMENVRRMARILTFLHQIDKNIPVDQELLSELELLPRRSQRFSQLLTDITLLTQQLEQRYRGILPFTVETTLLQQLATRLHIRRNPAQVLWQHNDRYERKMLELRRQRRTMLEFYFALNKKLRKQLHALIPYIQMNRTSGQLLREVVGYRDLLKRTVITPRIHQGMITARDQFAIDTTVFNMYEINMISGRYGNPGMTLALQISLSTRPEALISLDRKMRIQGELTRRDTPDVELPPIWLIPLFEDLDIVRDIQTYLERVWDSATQSRQTLQSPQERFAEILPEVFIAGSDLSQQVSQATGGFMFLKAKYEIQKWLAEHGLAEAVRIKLGSGEPMQRQGGYYSQVSGQPAFLNTESNKRRFADLLPAAARRSTAYAVTPLQGIFLGGDLRTFQSNLSEQLRYLPVADFVSLLHHVRLTQHNHRQDLVRAAETITESRMDTQSRNVQELERLTTGTSETIYEDFLEELTENFRQITYGRDEDVVGIHIISYFIGRSIPQLRDRPTSRRTAGAGADRGQQIISNIAEIIPFAKQSSLLRAIAHNQAQTMVLGINQLTTGLFRALERFVQREFPEADRERMIAERLLPRLPVYEILNTLRIYQDWKGEFLGRIETAFPAGNSAFVALREDSDAFRHTLPLFQQELLRRHGVNVSDFFSDGVFYPALLPTLRPDLAVLLQENIFNTDPDLLMAQASGRIDPGWQKETAEILRLPQEINRWRSLIWDVIGDSIYQRVQSFAELANALYSFSSTRSFGASPSTMIRGTRLPSTLAGFLRTARSDDEMRSFLYGAIEYLSQFAEGNIEVPVSIIRAMNDVERLAQIEENVLPPEKQDVIRFCLLQIARLAGENG